jgi:limonene-1,2-epoxide hydrolase
MIVRSATEEPMAIESVARLDIPKGEAFTLDKVRQLFSAASFSRDAHLDLITPFYDENVRFKDSLLELHGRDRLLAVTARFLDRCSDVHMEVHEASQTGNTIFVDWTAEVRMRPAPSVTFQGATKFVLDAQGKIIEHRDYCDVLGPLLDAVPGVGKAYRWVLQKLA